MNPVEKWHYVVKHKDTVALSELLANEVVFYSPVVHTPQLGKELTTMYLRAALRVFLNDTFTYVREVVSENNAILEFEVEIDGIKINGADMLQWNQEGKIIEFKVMVRPLKGVNMIHQKMGELLAEYSSK